MDSIPSGAQLGNYVIGQRVAEGGMGSVYEAIRVGTPDKVAIKVLTYHQDERAQQRFEREIETLRALHHPHIIPIYDYGEESGLVYFVMPLVEGASLADLLEVRHFSPLDVWNILQPVTQALDYAHQNNVIHRDIKPSNILVESESGGEMQNVYLVDFGLSKLVGAQSLTRTGIIVGTPHYISPEQVLDQPFTPQTDVYALSVVSYEALTGRMPFDGDSPEEIAFKHVEEEPIRPAHWHADFPPSLEAVIMRGMAKAPENRYETAGELCAAFADAMRIAGEKACRVDYWDGVE